MSFKLVALLIYGVLTVIYFSLLMAGRKDKTAYIPDPEDMTHKSEEDPFQTWECVLISIFWLPASMGTLIIGLIHKLIRFFKRK